MKKDFYAFLKEIKNRPKLLLHACCAPCLTSCLDLLYPYFTITIYYSNSNIDSSLEFMRRQNELEKIKKVYEGVDIIIDDYRHEDFILRVDQYKDLGEKSYRCYQCYMMRLIKTVQYAKENTYAYFTTTLSVSPHKVASWINEIGMKLTEEYNVGFIYSDFKKNDGYQKSLKMAQNLALYRQDYCGCEFSRKERAIDEHKF